MAEAPNTLQDDDLSFDLAFDAAVAGEAPPESQAPEPPELPPSDEVAPPPEPPAEEVVPPKAEEPPAPPAPQPPPVEPPPPPQPEPPVFTEYAPTEEEVQQLETMRSEFPEVASAIAVFEKVMISKFEKVLAEKLNEVHAQYAPVVATTQRIAQNEHEAAILSKHADAFSIVDSVSDWISKQPSILRKSYATVLDRGTAAEVIELLDVYKEAVKPPVTPPPPEPPKVDEEKERKLQALEGVRSRNTSERAALDPDDYDGAFDKFAASA